MYPTFDDRDAALLADRQASRDAFCANDARPQVGDLVVLRDGSMRHVTHCWDDGAQLTLPGHLPGGRFHVTGSGACSFSGSLDSARPYSKFTRAGTGTVRGWFFHHDHMTAHNGVDCVLTVTRWTLDE